VSAEPPRYLLLANPTSGTDEELQSPARVLAVRVVPRALNVLVEGGET
jgi:hypothetical protein